MRIVYAVVLLLTVLLNIALNIFKPKPLRQFYPELFCRDPKQVNPEWDFPMCALKLRDALSTETAKG